MNGDDAHRPTAVALSYGASNAPIVVAKGYGATADSIVHVARRNGVYVHESTELVGLLMQVQLDREIPPQLFLAVAEVMAWVARVDAKVAGSLEAGACIDKNQGSTGHG